ncbi:uncharacterized protein KD926_009838 [Aspergillus affinis]|uniref:uncharacterized protein n=1 Tax=Aspergillus affinis TaxID=1070780 RepID=UPI0022FE0E81|nr:uncharacterized protein KD926_009838 [Aspergillus affinis]KAI9039204.1 hypothetical protein KD926_009838 [Aspergillus affinis]
MSLLMRFRSLPLLFAVLLFTLHVLAHPNHHGHFGLDRAVHNNALSKRWLTIKPSNNNKLWPDATVEYTWADKQAKKELETTLKQAMDLWYRNGLPKQFKLKEASKLRLNKKNVLKIHYNDKGIMSTSNGIPNTRSGPVSHLSKDPFIGMQDAVANVAHEIGHMFGLLHEHQDGMYWGLGVGEPVFDFHCENLKDYEEKTKGKTKEQIDGDNGICKSREEAAKAGFSAAEYLPFMGNTRSPHSLSAGHDDVDWDSIMLYPSGAGGKESTQTTDKRAPVLLKKKGKELIQPNKKPSAKDVQALKDLYNIK